MEFFEGLFVEEYVVLDDGLETCEVVLDGDSVWIKESKLDEIGFYVFDEEDDGGFLGIEFFLLLKNEVIVVLDIFKNFFRS